MSFLRYWEAIKMMYTGKGVTNLATPVLIIPMSLQSAIPQQVALQQSLPPLHRLALNLVQFNPILQYTSGTFFDEATNTISSTFLSEATGTSVSLVAWFSVFRISLATITGRGHAG